jgi:daunorubicin resistance ABC transporter ATP-binding subunit
VTDAIIEVRGVKKAFKDTKALDGVDLDVQPGTVLGLLGPNGAGKTTLVRVLATLLKPDAGTARVNGLDVVANPQAVRQVIGLAGQYAAVDEALTGRENLQMVGRLYGLSKTDAAKAGGEALERLALTDAADRPVRTYSGGMRRRLDLGASLVGRPKVLILDEPTTGLDPRTRIDMWGFMRDLVREGTTVLLTTQYLDEADELADNIVVIDHGKVIAEGTSEQLKTRLGGDVLDVKVHRAPDLAAMAALFADIGGGKPQTDEAEGRVRVAIGQASGVEVLLAAVRKIDEAGIQVDDIGLHKPSLDDVFLSLTGRSTAVEETTEPAAKKRRGRS